MKALRHLIKKEFIQIRRSRSMLAISFGVPVIQLLILGFAVSTDVVRVPTVVTDLDNSPMSRSLVRSFEVSRYLDIRRMSIDIREGRELLQWGDAIISITIPRDFGAGTVRGEQPVIAVTADAQNTNVALTGASYVRRIVRIWAAKSAGARAAPPPVSAGFHSISAETRIWYNPELESVNYMVPGIIVLLVTIITIMLTAMAIVREREMGTLEQLMVTPISRIELILGKTIPFGILGMVELFIALTVARAVYHIPIMGSLPLFFGISLVFLLCTLGLGIFLSTIATTQQQALFYAWFVLVFCILMSGFFLPLGNMPGPMKTLTLINPLRYYLTIVRDLFLKGAGFAELQGNVYALAIFAVIIITASVARFNKNLG